MSGYADIAAMPTQRPGVPGRWYLERPHCLGTWRCYTTWGDVALDMTKQGWIPMPLSDATPYERHLHL